MRYPKWSEHFGLKCRTIRYDEIFTKAIEVRILNLLIELEEKILQWFCHVKVTN
jgi:hypothetical protein